MAGTTVWISYDSSGKLFGFKPAGASISADGRYVAFAALVVYQEIQQASQVTKFYKHRSELQPASERFSLNH